MAENDVFQTTDALPYGFFQLDAEDRITVWNRWVEDKSGRKRGEVIGRPLREIYPEAVKLHHSIAEVRKTAQPLLRSQMLHQYILPIPLPSGHLSGFEWMQQECHLVPLDVQGGSIAISVRDVTPIVVGRNRLLTLQKEWKLAKNTAIRNTQRKTEFLNVMSHEIRTPLNAIHMFCTILLSEEPEKLSEEQLADIRGIQQATQDLTNQVNDLLDVGKIEAGKVTLRTDEFTAAELFESLNRMLHPLANNSKVALVFEPVKENEVIRTDQNKLSHILRNLITNALKFTKEGFVRVSSHRTIESVVWRVTDTGIGIAPENLNEIFEDFYQIENEVQKGVAGTGLGLSISKKLTALLGGTLNAESVQGKGSVFSVSIPLERLGLK
ncbi:MAG: putative SigmaB asociated two-component system sensor protein [Chthoniobacteraceae bacterium]|nr:putative SigmaB asociated two-component system sensor protein [Chthoniobacteraceae bacterium]